MAPVVATVDGVGLAVLAVLTREDRRRTLPRAALLTVPATLDALLLSPRPTSSSILPSSARDRPGLAR